MNHFHGKNEDERKLGVLEMPKIIRACAQGSEEWFLILLLAVTGARVGELAAMAGRDIFPNERLIGRNVEKRKRPLYRRVSVGSFMDELAPLAQKKSIFTLGLRGLQERFKAIHARIGCLLPHSIHAGRHWHGMLTTQSTRDSMYAKYRLAHTPKDVTETYGGFDEYSDSKRWTLEVEPYLKEIGFFAAVREEKKTKLQGS